MPIKNDQHLPSSPTVIIVMGVSGCGKSTLANAIAAKLKLPMYDADDFHPEENKQHMASGQPLTDAMRLPWVMAIRNHLEQLARTGQSSTLAFSGLRRAHRDRLRIPQGRVLFVHLMGEKTLIAQRMKTRENHFMPASLLESQFDSLEDTNEETDVIQLDIAKPIDALVSEVLTLLKTP